MSLKENYISESESAKEPDAEKTVLSNDAYAICEFIEELTNKIELLKRLIRFK